MNPCGDGVCHYDPTDMVCENTVTCSVDCNCDNGTCDHGETTSNCPSECYCGNGRCDSGENYENCVEDCFF
jgi:hypothetical protein